MLSNKEAIWIEKHIAALDEKNVNTVYHFNIIKTIGFTRFKEKKVNLNQRIIGLPFQQWFILEIFFGLWLSYQLLIKKIHKEYDVINFHIAYPMLTYWHLIKRWVKKPIVITEHWSAYHFNFGVKKKLTRIQKIFRQKIPVITVSKALAKDIRKFAHADFPYHVVPNVVDDQVFTTDKNEDRKPFLFMVSQWKSPKTPLLVMQAFLESELSHVYTLKIAGYGPLWNEMEDFVKAQNAEKRIDLIGALDSQQIAWFMKQCSAFLHPSDYETFSVVCAEAVACGAYVISPKLGGIPEVVGNNGKLMSKNSLNHWKDAFQHIPNTFKSDYDGRFSLKNVGQKYILALKIVKENFEVRR